MADHDEWEGTPSELLSALYPIAEEMRVANHPEFPKNARWVTRRVKEVRVNLKEKGISCEFSKSGPRKITLSQGDNFNVHDVHDVQDGTIEPQGFGHHGHEGHHFSDIVGWDDDPWSKTINDF